MLYREVIMEEMTKNNYNIIHNISCLYVIMEYDAKYLISFVQIVKVTKS